MPEAPGMVTLTPLPCAVADTPAPTKFKKVGSVWAFVPSSRTVGATAVIWASPPTSDAVILLPVKFRTVAPVTVLIPSSSTLTPEPDAPGIVTSTPEPFMAAVTPEPTKLMKVGSDWTPTPSSCAVGADTVTCASPPTSATDTLAPIKSRRVAAETVATPSSSTSTPAVAPGMVMSTPSPFAVVVTPAPMKLNAVVSVWTDTPSSSTSGIVTVMSAPIPFRLAVT